MNDIITEIPEALESCKALIDEDKLNDYIDYL